MKPSAEQLLEVNIATHAHINLVRQLLRVAAVELLKRGEVHDQSKFSPEEVEMYATFTPLLKTLEYNSPEYKQCLVDMGPGLQHHYANNSHHPEYHAQGIAGMNLFDVLEMFLDWYASTKRNPNGDILKSLEFNQKRFGMSDELVAIMRNTVEIIRAEVP